MQHVTDKMLADAINAMPNEIFDTHAVEQRVLRVEPVAFANQILVHQTNQDVLRQFSASFSRRIGQAFPGQVERLPKTSSQNLAGNENDNQEWRRLVPRVLAAP
jgi:hypothetical protein